MRKDFERCHVTAHGNVAVLTMNHPEVLNAASVKMVYGMIDAVEHIEKSGDFRALVLTGEGRGFCAGANLTEVPDEGAQRGGVDALQQRPVEEQVAEMRRETRHDFTPLHD